MSLHLPRSESGTLRAEEERLRAHLERRFDIRTRFAPMPDVRALLVSASDREGSKGLVVSSEATIPERIYLYVHIAAHVALGHNLPLTTIVEGTPGVARLVDDTHAHREAERLARAMWWDGETEGLAAPSRVRESALLRSLLARDMTRSALRSVLLALRAAYYYGAGGDGAGRPDAPRGRTTGYGLRRLGETRVAAWLRDALCVTAVVSVAPQLSD